jgi:hypothetical protein
LGNEDGLRSFINQKRGLIMTVAELYSSVAQLGFETSLESDERFYYAVNRALLQVNRINPITSIVKINHFPLKNLLNGENFEPVCKKDKAIVFMAENARSYYFECNGTGTMIIENSIDGNEWRKIDSVELSSNGQFKQYKGFIRDGGIFIEGIKRLRFTGDYLYYVQNVAMYADLISDKVSDIPAYARFAAYDIGSLANDFISLAYPPIVDVKRDDGFVLNRDYFIEGDSKILIPASTQGVFDICYNRTPKMLTEESLERNDVIELNPELSAILPNLVASYIWVDDEPDKAQYYLSLYREQVAEILAQKRNMRPAVYRNKTGW